MLLYLPHFNLQNLNTLASPATAQFFVSVATEPELLEAIKFARERNLPLLVLGGGSNIVLRDDFPGLVVQIRLRGIEVVAEDNNQVYIKAAAGENWHDFVSHCLDCHYWGLENLSLIPGSVGAAPIQNIGAYGVELESVFSELTAVDIASGLAVTFPRDSCQFSYRDSLFKHQLKDKYIITSVTFKLQKVQQLVLDYPALQKALIGYAKHDINASLVSEVICNIRSGKLPDPKQIPNVGSFFKNPMVSESCLHSIQQAYPEVVFYPGAAGQVKLAAAWLIDRAGWRGRSECGASVHSAQALVLTNPDRRKGQAVLDLAQRIEQSVFKMFGVHLEIEPRIYPS